MNLLGRALGLGDGEGLRGEDGTGGRLLEGVEIGRELVEQGLSTLEQLGSERALLLEEAYGE